MGEQERQSAYNLWDNSTFKNLLTWIDDKIEKKIDNAMDLDKEERDAELDEAAAFRKFKKMIVNKVRNSI